MGTYYVFYCIERKEWIDPGDVDDGPIKLPAAVFSPVGALLIHLLDLGWDRLMPGSRWPSVRLSGDVWPHQPGIPSHEEITTNSWASKKYHNDWRDVTAEAIASFNDLCDPEIPLRHTPRRTRRGK